MIIAEYTLDHPILRHAREHSPGIEVTWEESYTAPDGRRQFIAWVECEDFETTETAIRDDPSVAEPSVLTATGGRRLYRFDLIGEGAQADIMPLLMEVGGVHLELVATAAGWRNRTRFPDREAFERLVEFCRERDIDVTFERLWEPSDGARRGGVALTEPQREALVTAVDGGYFEIPRDCSLAELGARLGVSQSAASERLRRGTKRLVARTLHE